MSFKKNKKPKTLNEIGDTGKESLTYKVKSSRNFFFLSVLILLFFMIAGIVGEIVAPTKAVVEERPTMRILFIGNSYTYHNNMPQILGDLAQHDPSAHFYIKSGTYVKGGATLAKLWNDPIHKDILHQEKWDYVVLQPQSFWAMTSLRFQETDRATELWAQAIRNIGAKPVFFMTWPRHTYSPDYNNVKLPFLGNPMQMYENIARRTEYLTKKHDLMTVNIGDYWFYSILNTLDIRLYEADGSHPSLYGASLNAMIFYKTLIDDTLNDIRFKPEKIPSEKYDILLSLASQKL